MKNEPSTLEADLKELMGMVRKINALEQEAERKAVGCICSDIKADRRRNDHNP